MMKNNKKKKEDYIYVDNVVQEPKMHFFKFPKYENLIKKIRVIYVSFDKNK